MRLTGNKNSLKGYSKKTWIFMILLVLLQKKSFILAMMVLKIYPEAVIWRCSVEKVFLEASQNSKKNNFARVSFFCSPEACNFTHFLQNTSSGYLWLSFRFLRLTFLCTFYTKKYICPQNFFHNSYWQYFRKYFWFVIINLLKNNRLWDRT